MQTPAGCQDNTSPESSVRNRIAAAMIAYEGRFGRKPGALLISTKDYEELLPLMDDSGRQEWYSRPITDKVWIPTTLIGGMMIQVYPRLGDLQVVPALIRPEDCVHG